MEYDFLINCQELEGMLVTFEVRKQFNCYHVLYGKKTYLFPALQKDELFLSQRKKLRKNYWSKQFKQTFLKFPILYSEWISFNVCLLYSFKKYNTNFIFSFYHWFKNFSFHEWVLCRLTILSCGTSYAVSIPRSGLSLYISISFCEQMAGTLLFA